MTNSIKKLELDFAYLEFFDHVIISTIKEDVVLEQDHIDELRGICHREFNGSEFVYISNRKYNYNVNPIIYLHLLQINTLKGIAILSNQPTKLQTALFEKQFSPVPFDIFDNKEEAVAWASGVITN